MNKPSTKYEKRIQKVLSSLNRGDTHEDRKKNQEIMLNLREGDYLIKSTNKIFCFFGYGYFGAEWDGIGITMTTRKNAQWFSREEAVELISLWNAPNIKRKGRFKMVKR